MFEKKIYFPYFSQKKESKFNTVDTDLGKISWYQAKKSGQFLLNLYFSIIKMTLFYQLQLLK
jgi:hypothetical protein